MVSFVEPDPNGPRAGTPQHLRKLCKEWPMRALQKHKASIGVSQIVHCKKMLHKGVIEWIYL